MSSLTNKNNINSVLNYTIKNNEIPSLRHSTPTRTKTYTLYFVGKIRYHC